MSMSAQFSLTHQASPGVPPTNTDESYWSANLAWGKLPIYTPVVLGDFWNTLTISTDFAKVPKLVSLSDGRIILMNTRSN